MCDADVWPQPAALQHPEHALLPLLKHCRSKRLQWCGHAVGTSAALTMGTKTLLSMKQRLQLSEHGRSNSSTAPAFQSTGYTPAQYLATARVRQKMQ